MVEMGVVCGRFPLYSLLWLREEASLLLLL